MTTTVTEQEKREALARWEGWTYGPLADSEHNAWTRSDAVGYYAEPPDYWNDGNAMLRLLEKAPSEGIAIHINVEKQGTYVHASWPSSSGVADRFDGVSYQVASKELPDTITGCVAEAVYEAIQ